MCALAHAPYNHQHNLKCLQVFCVNFRLPPCRFYHAFYGYMTHAFPHDELKPLTSTYTNSLGGLRDNG